MGGAGHAPRCAPASMTAVAALHSVPAVSTMSSTMMASVPFTSPMMCMTSATFGAVAPLVDDREGGVEALGEGARALDAAGVGRDDDELASR